MAYLTRYNVPETVFAFPLIFAAADEFSLKDTFKKLLLYVFIGIIMLSGLKNYYNYIRTDNTYSIQEVTQFLQENGYTQGYATFWNANIMTELSDGLIEVWDWLDGIEPELSDINVFHKWLQPKSHINPPKEKFFAVFTAEEHEKFTLPKLMNDENIVFSNGNHIVYGYESFNDYTMQKTDFTQNFGNGRDVINGEDKGIIRTLFPNGVSYTPYITLYPGEYEITINGQNISNIDFVLTSDGEVNIIDVKNIRKTTNKVTFTFHLDIQTNAVTLAIRNLRREYIYLHNVNIRSK